MATPRPQVRLRRWLVTVALATFLLLGSVLFLLRVKFEGADLGEGFSAMLNRDMRGRLEIASIEWPVGALRKTVTGGWVPFVLRDVRVWDDKGVPVLHSPRVTLELDLHALMFGRHDVVLRHIEVHGGEVLLREITEPYPLHDYDTTVFSLLAAFYGKRSVAGYYLGVQATTAPRFDLRDYQLHDVDVDIRLGPYGEAGLNYKIRWLLEDVSADGFLFMDPSDPIVPKFYFALAPRSPRGQFDYGYEPQPGGKAQATYSVPMAEVNVTRLRQIPAAWPESPVANTLDFALDITTVDGARGTISGAMRDYWADVYDGTWDVRAHLENAGPTLRRHIDPDLGGDAVTIDADITGPIVLLPKVDAHLTGLTYDLTALEPPLHLELEALHAVFDFVVDRGTLDEFVARGAGGKVSIKAAFGGDGTNASPFKVDATVRIDEPIDMAQWMPPCLAQAAGTKLSGHMRLSSDEGTTTYLAKLDDVLLRLGRLTVGGGTAKDVIGDQPKLCPASERNTIYADQTFGVVYLRNLHLALDNTAGTVCGEINTTTRSQFLAGHAESGDLQGLVRRVSCPVPPPAAAKGRAAPRGRPTPSATRRRAASAVVARRDRHDRHDRAVAPTPRRVHGQAPTTPTRRGTGGSADFVITGTFDAPKVQSTARLDGVPVVGALTGAITYEGDHVDVDASTSRLGGSLRARGRVRLEPTTSLEGVRVTARKIELGRLREPIPGLTGKVSADLLLRGPPSMRGLAVSGWACAPGLTVAGDAYADVGVWLDRTPAATPACAVTPPALATPVLSACGEVARAGGRCAVARARRVAGGELAAAVSIDRGERLGGTLSVRALPLSAITHLADTTLPVGAVLDASALALGGTLDAPELTGAIGIRRAWLAEAHLGDGSLVLRSEGPGRLGFTSELLDGRIALRGRVGTAPPYRLDATIELTELELDTLVGDAALAALGLPAGTRAWTSGRIHVRTALADPAAPLEATVELTDLSVSTSLPGPDGLPVPLVVRAAAPITLEYDGTVARVVGAATLSTPFGPLTLEGRIGPRSLDLAAGGVLDLARAQPLLGELFDRTAGVATLAARISGSTAAPRVQATLDLAAVSLHLPKQDAVLRVPAGRIELSDRQLSFTGMSVEVDDGFSAERPTLSVAGGVALAGLRPARWSVIVSGELAGEMLVAAAPSVFAQASGTADLSLTLSGAGLVPKVSGELAFDRRQPLTVLPRALRREIALTEGSLSFSTEDITFDGVGGTIDEEGRLRGLTGVVELVDGGVAGADVELSADAVPFRLGRSLDLVLDVPELSVLLDDQAGLEVRGQVTVVDGRFTQNFDLGEFLRPTEPAQPAAPPVWESWPVLGNATLALGVDVRRFAAVSNLFSLDAAGALTVSGSPRDPRLGGTIQITRGNVRLPAARARFTRTTGAATFSELVPLSASTIELSLDSEADYRDPAGQDHLVTMTLRGPLSQLNWDLTTASGLNKAQTLTLILSGRTPDQFRRSLGNEVIGADPTRIDPSTASSQGYTDELVRQLAGDVLTRGISDTLRGWSLFDVARIEFNLAAFGFHGEKRVFESVDLLGDVERTTRGLTLSGKLELRPLRQLALQGSYLRKDYDDPAESDVIDFEAKVVGRMTLRVAPRWLRWPW